MAFQNFTIPRAEEMFRSNPYHRLLAGVESAILGTQSFSFSHSGYSNKMYPMHLAILAAADFIADFSIRHVPGRKSTKYDVRVFKERVAAYCAKCNGMAVKIQRVHNTLNRSKSHNSATEAWKLELQGQLGDLLDEGVEDMDDDKTFVFRFAYTLYEAIWLFSIQEDTHNLLPKRKFPAYGLVPYKLSVETLFTHSPSLEAEVTANQEVLREAFNKLCPEDRRTPGSKLIYAEQDEFDVTEEETAEEVQRPTRNRIKALATFLNKTIQEVVSMLAPRQRKLCPG